MKRMSVDRIPHNALLARAVLKERVKKWPPLDRKSKCGHKMWKYKYKSVKREYISEVIKRENINEGIKKLTLRGTLVLTNHWRIWRSFIGIIAIEWLSAGTDYDDNAGLTMGIVSPQTKYQSSFTVNTNECALIICFCFLCQLVCYQLCIFHWVIIL